RLMPLSALPAETVRMLLRRHRPDLDGGDADALVELAEGSIGRALELAGSAGVELARTMTGMLTRQRGIDPAALHALAHRLGRPDAEDAFRAVEELLRRHLARQATRAARDGQRGAAARWAELREEIGGEFLRADGLNLDRKQTILGAFFAIDRFIASGAADR